ncbi:hypothetical protein CHY_0818 [Carboxydothermus hydrogenoformans Z-2901]|uniref:Spo0E like sporulation regulatory protein n=1 Tax=Carboxydothermus hydrogenoformans (strain ATCC BAA-161 / DSM 6008 / Z-2901) TaxID=246194 RepID=Q3ADW2_CARHZ|nr:hypothetical protein CHY_0818 [Carboxydothermus hydrogenoformans Z-2901]
MSGKVESNHLLLGRISPEVVFLQNKKIEILLKTIELLKAELAQLIDEVAELTNPEVVKKSQELDRILIEYYKLLKSTNKENT